MLVHILNMSIEYVAEIGLTIKNHVCRNTTTVVDGIYIKQSLILALQPSVCSRMTFFHSFCAFQEIDEQQVFVLLDTPTFSS